MRTKVIDELVAINILTTLLVVTVTFLQQDIPRYILGVPVAIFFPGYALMAAVFPRHDALSKLSRVGLSFGLSFTVAPLIGLALNYSPWGITLETVLYSTAAFILITSGVAWSRRRRLPQQERFNVSFRPKLPPWGGQSWQVKFLSIGLIVAIIGALGTMGYAISTRQVGERYTSFYVLTSEGDTTNYPTELHVGEEAKIKMGIINHEHESVNYRIEIRVGNVKNNEVEPVTLEHGEKWEQVASFVPNVVGDNQKVEFLLYRLDQDDIYRRLYLWIDVTE